MRMSIDSSLSELFQVSAHFYLWRWQVTYLTSFLKTQHMRVFLCGQNFINCGRKPSSHLYLVTGPWLECSCGLLGKLISFKLKVEIIFLGIWFHCHRLDDLFANLLWCCCHGNDCPTGSDNVPRQKPCVRVKDIPKLKAVSWELALHTERIMANLYQSFHSPTRIPALL